MTHPEVPPAPCGLVPRHSLGIRPCAVTSHMNQVNLNIKHLPVEYNLLQYKVAQVKRRLGDGSRSPKPPPPRPVRWFNVLLSGPRGRLLYSPLAERA